MYVDGVIPNKNALAKCNKIAMPFKKTVMKRFKMKMDSYLHSQGLIEFQ